jgi:cbb3-type cytochrome oxidase maturation protein
MMLILFMVSVALVLSLVFVVCYLWAVNAGQFNDLETPALRILKDDVLIKKTNERNQHEE